MATFSESENGPKRGFDIENTGEAEELEESEGHEETEGAEDADEADCGSIQFTADSSGERLDVFIARSLEGATRSSAQRIIERGDALRNGKTSKPSAKLNAGDKVLVFLPPIESAQIVPQDIPLDIVYQDSDFAVINKPKGMVVHPAPGHSDGTLVNALMYHLNDLSGIGGEIRPGIVHRIDKDTSGLILVAKNDFAHRSLCDQIKQKTASRKYLAIVEGNMKDQSGVVNAPIGRSTRDRKKMAVVVNGGRSAVTHWKELEKFQGYSLLECSLETGRTHQIRVHMAHVHHPIAGDPLYGPAKPKLGLDSQALHAYELSVMHPRTGESMTFNCSLPVEFERALEKLRK